MTTRTALLLALVGLASVTLAGGARAADPNKPHAHRGLLAPFHTPPPAPVLDANRRAALDRGDVVLEDIPGRSDGRRRSVFVVDAPAEVVWRVVTNLRAFPSYIPEVKRVEVTKVEGRRRDARFDVAQMGVALSYFLIHDYDDATRTGSWRLDYDKDSDLDDSIGFWRVTPWPDASGTRALVEYSAHVALKSWLPGFAQDIIRDRGLKDTATWVRLHSRRAVEAAKASTPARPSSQSSSPSPPSPTPPAPSPSAG